MLRQILSVVAIASVSLTASCQIPSAAQAEPGWITGRVVNDSGQPIAAQLIIGDERFDTSADGRFRIAPSQNLVYPVVVAAPGHYTMRHTFSHAELRPEAGLGDMTLVEQVPGRTMLVFGGDAMIGRRFYEPFEGEPILVRPEHRLNDSKELLREMKPYLELADYASINLETPIFEAPPGPAAPKSVTFYSAPETLEALRWAGVDYVALGNNHTYDFLEPGLEVTMEYLERSGLDYSGADKNEAMAVEPHRKRLAETDYDFLSFVGWPAGPPSQSAEENKGGAALGTEENLVNSSSASFTSGNAPVIQFHGGLEYVEEPTLAIETRLKQSVDAGAALVIAHHPHVTQGLELYNGKLIAWSLGNFLFDQYFYSAQSAALLYVWMDGDEFHHAEAVPLYIKGYHPTPAVGAMRNFINRRLYELSARRQSHLRRSGAHMILSAASSDENSAPIFAYSTDCSDGRQRIGMDLLARGDFDAHDLFGAPDRSWLDMDERIEVRGITSEPSDQALVINLGSNQSVETGMRKFLRVFKKGTPMTLRADLLSTANVHVEAFVQIRAEGQGLNDALENGLKWSIGKLDLNGGQHTMIDLDFDSPRVRTRSLRILLKVTSGDEPVELEIDDLQFIQWETPFSGSQNDCLNSEETP